MYRDREGVLSMTMSWKIAACNRGMILLSPSSEGVIPERAGYADGAFKTDRFIDRIQHASGPYMVMLPGFP